MDSRVGLEKVNKTYRRTLSVSTDSLQITIRQTKRLKPLNEAIKNEAFKDNIQANISLHL